MSSFRMLLEATSIGSIGEISRDSALSGVMYFPSVELSWSESLVREEPCDVFGGLMSCFVLCFVLLEILSARAL